MKLLQYQLTLLIFAFCFFTVSISCQTTKKAAVNLDPYMTFEQQRVDFGEVKVGERPEFVYKFKNTGQEPITIELISGCDCTEFIDTPDGKTFLPGEEGSFKIIFKSDTEPDRGPMEKTIDILLTNTDVQTGYQVVKEAFYNLVLVE